MSVQTIDDIKKQRIKRLRDLCEEIFQAMKNEGLAYPELVNVAMCLMMKVQTIMMEG